VQFRVLGPLEVDDDGRRLDLGPPKQRAVLALLLLHANQVVSLDRLIDELWDEEPPPRAPMPRSSRPGLTWRVLDDPSAAPNRGEAILNSDRRTMPTGGRKSSCAALRRPHVPGELDLARTR